MIIDLTKKAMERGEPVFLSCPKCGQHDDAATAWGVQVVNGKHTPIIMGIICPDCEHMIDIVNGEVRND